jgi:predicted  nucleic acid-binding Zn-ribbon protein
MAGEAGDGVAFYITWHVVEWAITAGWGVGSGVAVWVWTLGGKIVRLEGELSFANENIRRLENETDLVRRTVRQIGSALDGKIAESSRELEGKIDSMRDRLEGIREELPSRNFIETQFSNLTQRIDRAVEGRRRGVE